MPEAKLFDPLTLPCGVVLSSRMAKSAMSDSLGDGTGHPTDAQCRLYQRWSQGGVAVSIIGEVQSSPHDCEKPGNLVLDSNADLTRFQTLASSSSCCVQGTTQNSQMWMQLGHAGALAYPPTCPHPKGPSALRLPELTCDEMSRDEIQAIPAQMAATAKLAKQVGFGGVQIHAAHGFLLSQFLSPLFNKRNDDYGGDTSMENRARLLLETIRAVRQAVGPSFPIAVKLNSSDQLQGGLNESDSLKVVELLDCTTIDLIDISGGTYFPGAQSSSDNSSGDAAAAATQKGPYFLNYCRQARQRTSKPIMCTGGFKTKAQVQEALHSGVIDIVGLARALVLEPNLPRLWKNDDYSVTFPRFTKNPPPPAGGITAWYTMRLTELGEDRESTVPASSTDEHLNNAIREYAARDEARTQTWNAHFFGSNQQ